MFCNDSYYAQLELELLQAMHPMKSPYLLVTTDGTTHVCFPSGPEDDGPHYFAPKYIRDYAETFNLMVKYDKYPKIINAFSHVTISWGDRWDQVRVVQLDSHATRSLAVATAVVLAVTSALEAEQTEH